MTDLGLRTIRRAIISVSDKRGLPFLAFALAKRNVEIISTGGTKKALASAGYAVRDISDLTGFPEMMDGRLKTLHPKVHGGLLGIRSNAEHIAAMEAHGIVPVDLLVVNLYPFEQTVRIGADFDACVENIDVGGPAMIRAAAKNSTDVAVITNPDAYAPFTAQLQEYDGATTLEFRRQCMIGAFRLTSRYDALVADYLDRAINPGDYVREG